VEQEQMQMINNTAHPSPDSEQEKEDEQALAHRTSVRFTRRQWEALHAECFSRRMRGEKVNVAELIREIIDEWVTRVETVKAAGDAEFQ
jgi:hypothetical protein